MRLCVVPVKVGCPCPPGLLFLQHVRSQGTKTPLESPPLDWCARRGLTPAGSLVDSEERCEESKLLGCVFKQVFPKHFPICWENRKPRPSLTALVELKSLCCDYAAQTNEKIAHLAFNLNSNVMQIKWKYVVCCCSLQYLHEVQLKILTVEN